MCLFPKLFLIIDWLFFLEMYISIIHESYYYEVECLNFPFVNSLIFKSYFIFYKSIVLILSVFIYKVLFDIK